MTFRSACVSAQAELQIAVKERICLLYGYKTLKRSNRPKNTPPRGVNLKVGLSDTDASPPRLVYH